MIKRVVEISRHPAHLHVRLDQLCIETAPSNPQDTGKAQENERLASIPCEDIAIVLVDHPQTTYSHSALATLLAHGAAVVICGRDHLPAGILLPIPRHTEVVWRIRRQISVKKPLLKRLWKQIVGAKIRAQAANLPHDSPARRRLTKLATEVRSGDPSNCEAQAAKVYWAAWVADQKPFHRDYSGEDCANTLLNYGYAVLRAAVARALVAAGFIPALGIHHRNRSDAFALADDLVEPLRPMVDRQAREILRERAIEQLDQPAKASLLELLTATVTTGETTGPLMVALHAMCASLADCYAGRAAKLLIPRQTQDGG